MVNSDNNTPWIRPGVVVHQPQTRIDELLADFAAELRQRGFTVAGFVQCNNRHTDRMGKGCADTIELLDLATGAVVTLERGPHGEHVEPTTAAVRNLRAALDGTADLAVLSRFAAFERAGGEMSGALAKGLARGLPLLTSIAGRCLQKWQKQTMGQGQMVSPDMPSLWDWWGPERLYQDLALGVADAEVRHIAIGPRWLLVEGPDGTGLSHLPKSPAPLLKQLTRLQRTGLRQLAAGINSWDPLAMALGVAAINAHYNRYDLAELHPGNGADAFRHTNGRRVVIGAFPGLRQVLPDAQVIETAPKPGEYPTVAMDVLLPGCTAAVITSSTLVNRQLPRILRLARGARTALIGPATPLTPRLHSYGTEILGGLLVRDPRRLAQAIQAGAKPNVFDQFGEYVSLHAPPSSATTPVPKPFNAEGESPCTTRQEREPAHRKMLHNRRLTLRPCTTG